MPGQGVQLESVSVVLEDSPGSTNDWQRTAKCDSQLTPAVIPASQIMKRSATQSSKKIKRTDEYLTYYQSLNVTGIAWHLSITISVTSRGNKEPQAWV